MNNSQIKLQVLQPSDIKEYISIRKLSITEQPFAFSASIEELENYSENLWFTELLSNKTVLGLKNSSELIGIIEIAYNLHPKVEHVANIYNFYIKPEFRAKGLGKVLFSAAIEKVKSKNTIEKLQLQVTSNQTEAINLYKKFGFLEVGNSRKALKYNSEYTDILSLELSL